MINMVGKNKTSIIKPDKRQKVNVSLVKELRFFPCLTLGTSAFLFQQFSCGSPCMKGLHCGLCQMELLPLAQG